MDHSVRIQMRCEVREVIGHRSGGHHDRCCRSDNLVQHLALGRMGFGGQQVGAVYQRDLSEEGGGGNESGRGAES
jgi:hypothetical protein